MPNALRTAVLGTRTSSETKEQFASLAARQGLSESALLSLVVDNVLAGNTAARVSSGAPVDALEGCANDRVTLRLRPGDRPLADAFATARRMKTASYLAMLVRAHVRNAPVMPPAELDELRSIAGHVAALGRQLRASLAATDAHGLTDPDRQLLLDIGTTVESMRECLAVVVRANLSSWEAGHA